MISQIGKDWMVLDNTKRIFIKTISQLGPWRRKHQPFWNLFLVIPCFLFRCSIPCSLFLKKELILMVITCSFIWRIMSILLTQLPTDMNFYSVSIKMFFRFNFRCCSVNGFKAHTCQTTFYQNQWDQEIRYRVPKGFYLVGVISVHDNRYQ